MNLNTRLKIYSMDSNHSDDDYDAKQDWNRGRTTRRRNSMEHSIKRGQRLLHTQCLLQDVQLWKSLKHIEYEYEGCNDDDCINENGTFRKSGNVTTSTGKEEHDVTRNLKKVDGIMDRSDHSYEGDTDEEMQYASYSDDDDNDNDDCSYDTISIDGKDQEHSTIFLKNNSHGTTTTARNVLPYALQIQIDLHKPNKSSEKGTIAQKKYLKKTALLGILLIAFLISSYFKIDVASLLKHEEQV